MIHAVNKLLNEFEIHLASSSPRRKNILEHAGLKFSVTPSTFEENLDKSNFSHPREYVMETAKQKGLDVLHKLNQQDLTKKKFIIAADTVVVAEGEIFEKPKNHDHAYSMLQRFNTLKIHEVCSGVTMIKSVDGIADINQFYEMTQVEFGDIPDHVLKLYASSEEPLDKAGGYLFLNLLMFVRLSQGQSWRLWYPGRRWNIDKQGKRMLL